MLTGLTNLKVSLAQKISNSFFEGGSPIISRHVTDDRHKNERLEICGIVSKIGFQKAFGNTISALQKRLVKKIMQDDLLLKETSHEVLGDSLKDLAGVWWQTFNEEHASDMVKLKFGLPLLHKNLTPTSLFESLKTSVQEKYKSASVQQSIFFSCFLSYYFMSSIDGKENDAMMPIFRNVSLSNRTSSVLESYILSGGPVMLKVLQSIGKGDLVIYGLSISQAIGKTLNATPGLLDTEKEIILKDLKDKGVLNEEDAVKFRQSASIAQTIAVNWDTEKNERIIKIIKPCQAYYFLCEANFLLTHVWKGLKTEVDKADNVDPEMRDATLIGCRKLLCYLLSEFSKEFDYMQELENMRMLEQAYTIKGVCSIPKAIKVYDPDIHRFPFISQSRAPGIALAEVQYDQISREQKSLLTKNISLVVSRWFANVFLDTSSKSFGMFHADLHPGNIYVDLKNECKVTIIDFGSVGTMKKKDSERMLFLSAQCSGIRDLNQLLPRDKARDEMSHFVKPGNRQDMLGRSARKIERPLQKLLNMSRVIHNTYHFEYDEVKVSVKAPWIIQIRSVIAEGNFNLKFEVFDAKGEILINSFETEKIKKPMKEIKIHKGAYYSFELGLQQRELPSGDYVLRIQSSKELKNMYTAHLRLDDGTQVATFSGKCPVVFVYSANRAANGTPAIVNQVFVPKFISTEKLSYFVSEEQEKIALSLKTDRTLKDHELNLKLSETIALRIGSLCNVNVEKFDPHNMIQYDEPMNLGRIFARFALFSESLGECVTNGSIIFGRSVSYLEDCVDSIEKGTGQPTIQAAITKATTSNVRMVAKILYNKFKIRRAFNKKK